MTTLSEEAQALKDLRDRRDDAKATFDELDADLKTAKRNLLDRFEREGTDAHKTGGRNFVKAHKRYGNITDREAFIEWAQSEAPELLEVKERQGLLNEIAREHLDDGRPLPPGLDAFVDDYISIRAA